MIISHQIYDKKRINVELKEKEYYYGIVLEEKEKARFAKKEELLSDKTQQVARALPDERVGLNCVQSYVSNMSAATTLEELLWEEGETLPENLMSESKNTWTAPKWAKGGDIVFFMHSKTAKSKITALLSELKQEQHKMPVARYRLLMSYLDHALEIHALYGGKIFAVGRVCGGPEYVEPDDFLDGVAHWKSRNYSDIDNIHTLEKPIDISEFNDYIYISRGSATTPLFDREFERLRADIGKENSLPWYVEEAIARPIPLRKINDSNWVELANDYRRCFILEKQFRQFYVDYLLRAIGDQKKIFTECRCQRSGMHDSFMDYVIRFDGKYLPVETKLAVSAEPNIIGQVSKYVYNSKVFLKDDGTHCVTGNDFHPGKVLIIDTEKMYMYDAARNSMDELFSLGKITSPKDIEVVKKALKVVV